MKILALILHGQKSSQRFENISKTWGQEIDFLFYSDHNSFKTIKVTDRNDYASAELKQINIINDLPKEYLDYDWYLFCDDDTFINTKLLLFTIDSFNPEEVTGQLIQCWQPDQTLCYLSGGAGFLMSNKILKSIKGRIPNYNSGYSDVTMGLFYRENNIKIKHSELFMSQNPEFYNVSDNNISKFISFHYIKDYETMRKMHEICK